MRVVLALVLSFVLLLSACTLVVPPAGEDEEFLQVEEPIVEEVVEQPKEDVEYPPIDVEDLESSLTLESTAYRTSFANEWGDTSSFIQQGESTDYKVATQVTLMYAPGESLKGRTLFMKARDLTANDVVATQQLFEGDNSVDAFFSAEHTGMSPRFQVCVGDEPDFTIDDELCIQYSGDKVENKLTTSVSEFSFKAQRDEREKSIIVSNDGTTTLTAFVALPDAGEDAILSSSLDSFTLSPGTKRTITLSMEGDRVGGKVFANVYAIPRNCAPSIECASTARIKNEIEIQFQ